MPRKHKYPRFCKQQAEPGATWHATWRATPAACTCGVVALAHAHVVALAHAHACTRGSSGACTRMHTWWLWHMHTHAHMAALAHAHVPGALVTRHRLREQKQARSPFRSNEAQAAYCTARGRADSISAPLRAGMLPAPRQQQRQDCPYSRAYAWCASARARSRPPPHAPGSIG